MERRKLVRLMAGTAAMALMPGLAGCVVAGSGYQPAPAPRPVYRPPEYYNYYYYPNVAVYYHIQTGNYWYFSHGSWRRSRRLPGYIDLRGPRHRFVIRDENPYERHRNHRRSYGNPQRGYGPDDSWQYDRNDRNRGRDDNDDRGNGRDRRRDDNDDGGNGRDRPLGDDRNGNRGNGQTGDQNGIRRRGDDDRGNGSNRDGGQNNNGLRNRPGGDDDRSNDPGNNGNPTQNRPTPQSKPQLRPQAEPPPEPQVRPQPQDDDSGGDRGRDRDNGKDRKKDGDEQTPWLKKPKPDDQ